MGVWAESLGLRGFWIGVMAMILVGNVVVVFYY